MKTILYLGLDVHKDSIATAVAEEGRQGEVRDSGAICNDLFNKNRGCFYTIGRNPAGAR